MTTNVVAAADDSPGAKNLRVGDVVGRGATAVVRRALPEGSGLVVKSFLESANLVDIRREIIVHRSLPAHPNIVKFHSSFCTDAGKTQWHIVMDYATGGELFERIEPDVGIPPSKAAHYLTQLIAALRAMHERCIVHRDLKPENILLGDAGELKVADFGMATCYATLDGRRRRLRSRGGTRLYAAPEVLSGKEYDGEPVDVWSAGIVMALLLFGDAPWTEASEMSLDYSKYRLKGPDSFFADSPFTDLLGGMLCPEPSKRWPVSRVAKFLMQPPPRLMSLSNPELASLVPDSQASCFSQPDLTSLTTRASGTTRLVLPMPLQESLLALEDVLSSLSVQFKTSESKVQFGTVDRRNCPLLGSFTVTSGAGANGSLLLAAKKRGDWLEFKRFLSTVAASLT